MARLRNPDDQESWARFDERYRPLLFTVGVKAGLGEDEAREAAQETMISVSRHIKDFVADPAAGSFRGWLLKMARWRIRDQFRKRLPVAPHGQESPDATASTSTIDRVADPNEADLAGLCDAEWGAWLVKQAMEELRFEVKPDQFQIFHLLTVEQKSVPEVVRMVGRSRAQIYVVKFRVGTVLKRIVRRLREELERKPPMR